jgi:DNA-binding MarR family transcriptional regulator
VIRALDENGPLEPRQISDLCTISSPSIAGVLARMEAMGLVTKVRFEDDQRRVRASLTKQNVNLVRVLSKDLEAEYLALEREVGAEAVERVYRAVDALLVGLEQDGWSRYLVRWSPGSAIPPQQLVRRQTVALLKCSAEVIRVVLQSKAIWLTRITLPSLGSVGLAASQPLQISAIFVVPSAANRRFSVRTDIPLKQAIPCTSRSGCGIGVQRTLALGRKSCVQLLVVANA